MKKIGSGIAAELAVAGLDGLPFSWGTDGEITFGDAMTAEQRAAVMAVFEAHVAPSLQTAARAAAWERIKAARDRRTQAGGYQAGGKWFHSDTFSRTQQIGLVMLGANIPQGLMWKTMDGSFVEMTPTLAQQVFAAAAAQDTATFAAAETHKAAMEAAPDPAAYNFSAGWPAVFGE